MMLSKFSSALSFYRVLITVIHFSLGAPKSESVSFKKVKNNAAGLTSRSARSDHRSPTLRALHWLPVESRIQYTILRLTINLFTAMMSLENDQ